jgi:hypothetical protein
MKIIQYLSWICLVGVLVYNIDQFVEINYQQGIHPPFIGLQFADKTEGQELISRWNTTPTRHGTMVLQEAILNTEWDFLFILSYMYLLISLSYNEMQRQRSPVLNTLLRFSFPLAIITGLLDTIEDIILLNDMKPWNIGHYFYPSYPVSLAKFIIAGWIIVVWLLSMLARTLHSYTMTKRGVFTLVGEALS